jgi:hypothetical protein
VFIGEILHNMTQPVSDVAPGPLVKVIFERPVILTSEFRALGEGVITTYFKRLKFDTAGPSRAWTLDLPGAKREHYH